MYNECLLKKTFSNVIYWQYCQLHIPPPICINVNPKLTLDDAFRKSEFVKSTGLE